MKTAAERRRESRRAYEARNPGRRRGQRHSPERTVWQGMMYRCENPRHKDFNVYGGRGIKVCERWRTFENFVADMGPRPHGLQLDRIDNDKGYSPENCRWATLKEQANNTRQNHWIAWRGETRTIAQWAEITGFKHALISGRLKRGWTPERALSTPIDPVWSAYAKRGRAACHLPA